MAAVQWLNEQGVSAITGDCGEPSVTLQLLDADLLLHRLYDVVSGTHQGAYTVAGGLSCLCSYLKG